MEPCIWKGTKSYRKKSNKREQRVMSNFFMPIRGSHSAKEERARRKG